ncbi:hypothetical protein QSI_1521 [Clostridioides difficile P28]|nr:hypothetical protein QSI_1521 [Clostridioides difficile P28]
MQIIKRTRVIYKYIAIYSFVNDYTNKYNILVITAGLIFQGVGAVKCEKG